MSAMKEENEAGIKSIEDKLHEAWLEERKFYDFRGAARFLIWLVALVVVDLLIDWQIFFRERWETPGILLLVVNLVVLGWVLWKEWLSHRKPFDPVRVALEVESKHPELRSILVSYSQFKDLDPDEVQASPALLKAMRDQAVSLTKPLDFKDVVDFNQLKNLGLVCLLTLLGFSAVSFQWQDHMRALFMRLIGENADYPTNTKITEIVIDSGKTSLSLDPGDESEPFPVKSGGDVDILVSVDVAKEVPDRAVLYWTSEGMEEKSEEFAFRDSKRYECKISSLTRPTLFRLVIGDDRTREIPLSISPPPAFTAVVAGLTFPEYLGRPPSSSETLDFSVPAGTRIRWTLPCSPAISDLNVTLGGETIAAQVSEDGKTASFEANATETFRYSFPYVREKANGFEYRIEGEQEVEVVPDRVPEIVLQSATTASGYATPSKTLVVDAAVSDDYGLGEAFLVYSLGSREEKRVSLEELTDTSLSGIRDRIRLSVPLSELLGEAPEPGDEFVFQVEVSDEMPPRGTHRNLSSDRKLTILSEEKYLEWFKSELELQLALIAKARDSEKRARVEIENLKVEEKKE